MLFFPHPPLSSSTRRAWEQERKNVECELLTDPGGGWLEVPVEQVTADVTPMLNGTGDHRMSPLSVFVDHEIIGDAFVDRFNVRITRHRHFDDRCPVRDMIPYDARLLKDGFVGAAVTLHDGRNGQVLSTASVSFEGESKPSLCYIVSFPGAEGAAGEILAVPATEACQYVKSMRPRPAPEPEDDLSFRPDSPPKPGR